MNQFDQLLVRGFRRLQDLNLPLRPLCVLIGANGSGKTSVLDVFSLLAASASGKLNQMISDLEGISAILTQSRAKELSFGLSMPVANQQPLLYQLTITPTGVAYEITEETLSQDQFPTWCPFIYLRSQRGDVRYYPQLRATQSLMTTTPAPQTTTTTTPAPPRDPQYNTEIRPTWQYNRMETSLAQVPKIFKEPEEFRQHLASSTHYHALNVESRAPVRLPQPLRPESLPGRDGENLVSCLFSLRETERDRFEAIEDTLRAAFPGFQRLDFPPVAAGTLAMTWKDSNFTGSLYMHQLSEGTLRFLWLATLLQSPGLTAVTLLDEPEVSLHPELLKLLAELLREASTRTQVIVATHADRLIRFLHPSEVLTLDLAEDGRTQATWADELDLEEWLKEYTLDDVWRLGRIGGRA
jgi:predicted ATPase